MKVFVGALLGALGLIFTVNLIVDPLGLRDIPIVNITAGNPEHCAIDLALVPEAAQEKLKETLLAQSRAETVVVGNSRVMMVRGIDLGTQSFVNFGISGMFAESYPALADRLIKYPYLRTVYLSLEFNAFGNQSLRVRLYDRAIHLAERVGAGALVTRLLSAHLALEGSPVFADPLRKILHLLSEYTSEPATARTFAILRTRNTGGETRRVLLPAASTVEGQCLLSSRAPESVHNAWSGKDASILSRQDLFGEKLAPQLNEYDRSTWNGEGIGNHWSFYRNLTALSDVRFALLETFLRKMHDHHIQVIGFMMPYPQTLLDGFDSIGVGDVRRAFDKRAVDLFAKYGFIYVVPKSGPALGCDDMMDYSDPWHPMRRCMQRAMADVVERQF